VSNPKIHLIFTCLTTNVRRDGSVSEANRLDYLWRSLESLRNLPISSGDFYLAFGSDVVVEQRKLLERIESVCEDFRFFDHRLESFIQWHSLANDARVNSADIVFLITYEDHENISTSNDEFLSLVNLILEFGGKFPASQPISILSHFPEAHLQADGWRSVGLSLAFKTHYLVPAVTPIGCLLVRPKDFQSWFRDDFTQGTKLVSTENYFGPSVLNGKILSFVPQKEQFRHIDGYRHVGLPLHSDQLGEIQIATGLIGRSFTYTSLRRIGWKISLTSYLTILKVEPGLSPLANTLRGILASYSLFSIIASSLTPLHLKLMERFPFLYHLGSVGFSHGFMRFLRTLLRDFFGNLRERTFKSPNITG
jgi:hypothetical protein